MSKQSEKFLDLLEESDACNVAMDWLRVTKGSPKQLWKRCPNAAWMAWYLEKFDTPDISTDVFYDMFDELDGLVPEWAIDKSIQYWKNYPYKTKDMLCRACRDVTYVIDDIANYSVFRGEFTKEQIQYAKKILEQMTEVILKHIPTLPEIA